ncbi:MAG: T9SS type A sorting domain-containing protein [Saprospiraceae bacterium]|nr:T9SS type A sorting domain-containing protein [Saprospiraceae bacterium]MBK9726522.1 T9SS type A sorting domain-containing protein [Saprospiraceae bacterium]
MKKNILFIFILLSNNYSYLQIAIADTCFSSSVPQISFNPSSDMVSFDADLMEWDGSNWIGAWPGGFTIPPPSPNINCRAIFIGSGKRNQSWTSGGEGFGLRLTQPLVSGQLYKIPIVYVSHGPSSDGKFKPKVYSSKDDLNLNKVFIDSLPAANFNWTAYTLSFIADSIQHGHDWLIINTDSITSSGMISSFCSICASIVTSLNDQLNVSDRMYYPNPFSNKVYFNVRNNLELELTLFDVFFKVYYKTSFINFLEVKTDNFPSGIYFYELKTKNRTIIGKLLKE